MPANYSRPQPSYIVISRPNDKRYQLLTRNKKRPPTDFLFDLDFGYLIDVVNQLDLRMDSISLGDLPGVANPINFNKFLVPDGAGSSTWAFVSAANILDASITGIKLFPQAITERELADGGIPTSKIQQKAITTALLNDEGVTTEKLADEAVTREKIGEGAVNFTEIANNAVRTEALADDAVVTSKILDANVTLAKLAQDVLDFMNSLIPIGSIIELPIITAVPSIYIEANGQLLSRVTYASLFAVYGTTNGAGDGATTFGVPDKRGRASVGIGSDNSTGGLITSATAPSIVLGGKFGAQTHKLTEAELAIHSHNVPSTDGGITGSTRNTAAAQLGDFSTNPAGGDQPHNNVQPSIFTKYYIRAL